ncbi:GNAT family N-acetyltransferase [Flavobacterium sp. GT3R68]|uniref:GNAT family N-acetyltransferase n=1 Tax=Flavobacterium sp. GT3R68 TaxID=2594437 RepID=UPI000F85EFEB|nr:GNAT family N-acetyltransferase [Flavobacterium sp. GT3R68]RTY90033.1 N-acetyltransferase [Flavobacterium sp. GSN2]TRW93356.1 N-acetyltransferase [Flavobacterium sp. GT3R68]
MSKDYSALKLTINPEKKRFEMDIDGHVAFIEFIINNYNILFLTHTEVPVALEGKGVGSAIVEKALRYMKEHNYTLAPLCSFVAKYVTKHPEWHSFLAKGYHV